MPVSLTEEDIVVEDLRPDRVAQPARIDLVEGNAGQESNWET